MTAGFDNLVTNLLGLGNKEGADAIVQRFLDDPEALIAEYDLNNEERAAFLARDVASLSRLGVHEGLTDHVLSGAHSQQCTAALTGDPAGCVIDADDSMWWKA